MRSGPGIKRGASVDMDRLRALVPDDPIPLPPEHLACEACGIAVPTTAATSSATPWPATENSTIPPKPVHFARCGECQRLREAADAYVSERPRLAAQLGDQIARERVESVLFAFAVLQLTAPDDLGLTLPRMFPAGSVVRFRNPVTLTRDRCSPRPWAHVTTGQRAALRAAYACVLKDRLALSEPPVTLPCPTRGCMLCGVPSISRSAIEVAQRGGQQAAVSAYWRRVTTTLVALGSSGPQPVTGHVCPDCSAAIEAERAVGPSARGRAVVAHVRVRFGDTKADRLRAMLADDNPPTLPAWAALRVAPNRQPWSHLTRVIDRL